MTIRAGAFVLFLSVPEKQATFTVIPPGSSS